MDDKFAKKLTGYFIAFCRKTDHWSPMYRETLKKAHVRKDGDGNDWYRCAFCKNETIQKNKRVDHIDPVVDPAKGWTNDWNEYRDRMFIEADKRQVLCLECHKAKTKKENGQRKERRKQCKKTKKKKAV